jgi:thioesterase domain-containing protein
VLDAWFQLRAGQGTPLFLLSGGGADVRELDRLVAALKTRRPLIGVSYWEADAGGRLPASVESMADQALRTILERQPHGPYSLAGYSLGGLVAVEVAHRLIERGQSVNSPILIDALPHNSTWPWPAFLRAGVRYLIHDTFRRRGSAARRNDASETAGLDEASKRCRDARDEFRPKRYAGTVRLIHATQEPYVGGLAPSIWRSVATNVVGYSVAARHLDLLRVDSFVASLARILDQLVDDDTRAAGKRRALVVTGMSWQVTARLASELNRTGFKVAAVAPRGHPITRLQCLESFHLLRPFDAQRSIEDAIVASQPDIVIPVDDFVTDLLHRLHDSTHDNRVRALIERSIGSPEFYERKFDRRWMNDLAASEGISVPRTVGVRSFAELGKQLEKTGVPAFLKVDGSWGGLGVARIDGFAASKAAWRRLSRTMKIARAIKRALFNGDASGIDRLLRPRHPVFSLQEAKDGQFAIVSAVCREGELLGMLSARVLAQQEGFGPATELQMNDRLPLRDAVVKIIRRLRLSGLCGFDFILSVTSGDAYFIELNPRATQTSDFIGERDGDLLAKLLTSLGGQASARDNAFLDGTIITIASVTGDTAAYDGHAGEPRGCT